VDIAKAFDTVSWPFLLEVLAQLGISQRWRDWISLILSASSSWVLVNGVPGIGEVFAKEILFPPCFSF
jgi:cell division inhibitor SulA